MAAGGIANQLGQLNRHAAVELRKTGKARRLQGTRPIAEKKSAISNRLDFDSSKSVVLIR